MTPERRVLLYSQRGLSRHVSRCPGYEFEDLVAAELETADILAPTASRASPLLLKARGQVARRSRLYRALPTGLELSGLGEGYDLLFAYVGLPRDLATLDAFDLRRRAGRAVVWLQELAAADVPGYGPGLEVLNTFDHVICGLAGTVPALAARLDVPVHYACWGLDALAFCPWPDPPERVIEFYNLSNVSQATHAALLAHAKASGAFYDFPTEIGIHTAREPAEHRWRYADRLKRSRYFYAGTARVRSRAEGGWKRGAAQAEFGSRYVEALAAGAILLGDRVATREFEASLGWEDAVIPVPYECPGIVDIIAGLDADPGRLAAARRRNVTQVLARHDCLHRWEQVLDLVGLPPTPGMARRREALAARAALVAAAPEEG
ncbi:MAG TPA: glycosyltransferase [Amaricoccus sp.]|jgi:hypothetical protein|uniref:glycosyltransferase n=1 Tax=Amaricoccus sp. TaxID=1872485 RepID=UPI002BC4A9BA|nr:glycosyltransferase [Amaricoccus sp.]HMR51714.1 glycosyltransferase [Amaricoccus sp.]HMT98598.1 glycosyltransferase [Amaricoccus sp.]